jgi:hypothetical protein
MLPQRDSRMTKNKTSQIIGWIEIIVLISVLLCFSFGIIFPGEKYEVETVLLTHLHPCRFDNGVWIEVEKFSSLDELVVCGNLITTKSPVEISFSIEDISMKKIVSTFTETYSRGKIVVHVPYQIPGE